MSRTEYRVQYRIYKDGRPMGRTWCHICHTRRQVDVFLQHIRDDAEKHRRQVGLVGIETRPVGRWEPWDGKLEDLL